MTAWRQQPPLAPARHARRRRHSGGWRFCLIAWLLALTGCHSAGWLAGPKVARPQPLQVAWERVERTVTVDRPGENCESLRLVNDASLGLQQRLSLAEAYYASGDFAERQGSCRSVDWFFGATMVAWDLSCDPTIDASARDARGRIESLYQSSLLRLLRSSQRFGRFDPASGLAVELPQGKLRVPVVVHSNVWCTADLGHFTPVGEYDDPGLTHRYRTVGRGVPVVARRREGRGTPMVPDGQPFALTALLHVSADRPAETLESPGVTVDPPSLGCAPILEFYDPFLTHNADVAGCPVPLATDISAPLAYAHHFATFSPVRDFLQPDDTVRLAALGPHERGKIPIIFVHGLLSEPLTYLDMANEIRGDAVLSQRYEIWGFRYPTGGAVLEAAAGLREQLARAVADFPGCDPALSQMVIVGHSMGGLVSKLQVTESGTVLWDRLATRPFTELRASDEVRMKLARAVFFQPSPAITRIVYIATPHEGSPWADRLVGRAASHCVRLPPENVAGMQQVVVDNPGLLQPTAPKRPPTSIDLLEPSSTVLQGFRDLRYGPCVKVHSIVGTGRTMVHGGPADGVVPVVSAREPASISEVEVPATHSEILRDQRTICELKRILIEHLRTVAHSAPEGLERETIVPAPAAPESAAPGNTARARGGAAR